MLLSLFLWQSTEIIAAPTAASATVDGKTVNYSYEFTESGGDVTFSITITSIKDGNGDDATITGLVNPTFYDGSNNMLKDGGGAITIGSPNTFTWTQKNAEDVLSIRANYPNGEQAFNLPGTGTFNYTVQGGGGSAITAPTDVPAVKTVGTDGITAVRALYNQGTPGYGFAFDDWGSSTIKSSATVDSKAIDLFNNFTFYGSNYTAFDATGWEKLVVDIYPMDNVNTVAIMPIKQGTGGKGQQFTVTPGQWNSLELDMATLAAAGLDITGINQIMIGGSLDGDGEMVHASGNGALYVGNIYLYSLETPIPTSVKLYIKGETVSGINMIPDNYAQGDLEVEVLDQNGHIMPGRNVELRIVNSDSQATLVNTTVASGGKTAFQTHGWVGQTTIQGVDASGVTGYCYITCFKNDQNLVNANALHDGGTSDVKEWSSGGVEGGIRTSDALWEDPYTNTKFGLDLKGYYDISAFQLMFDQGKFPTEYTIQVAQSGSDYEHAVWKDVYHYTPSKEVYVDNNYRCDVWNEQSNFTKAIRYIRFTSTSESGVTFKRFQVLGNYVSDAISDNEAPVVVSANASEITKNSAVLTMVGSDNSNGNLTYIITNKNTGLTHTVQAPTSTTIYVKSNNAPALYAYKDDGTVLTSGNDGETMTTKTTDEVYWKQTFNASPININFRSQPNNSSPTTPNINNLTGDNYFTYDGNTGYTRENVPSTVTVYVKAATAPYLYVWDDSNNALNGAWPGTQLTQKSGDYWVYTYDADHINIQFNNGQSGDTNKSWDVTGVSGESYFTYNGTNSHSSDNHATYALSNLQASTTYTYEVVAFDGINYSAPVNVTFTTLADNTAPTVVFASPDPVTHLLADGATLNFTGTDANSLPLSYIITNKNTGATVQTEGNSGAAIAYVLSGLAPNTEYTFGVKAYNGTMFSGEATTTFTTRKLGGDLKIKFSADGQEYLGFTGELEKLITDDASTPLNDVTTLYIDGPLNSDDIKTLRTMAGGKYQIKESDYATNQGSLATLNMEAATFVADNGIFVETYYENGQTVRWDPVYLTEAGSNMYNYIFYGCKNLVNVVLPTGVERLGEYSFFKCENLENINTANVKVFDRSCLQGDTKLGQITISDGCTRLAYAAFSLCRSMTLTSTVLPSSITQLADIVFQNCEALTEITYPNNAALAETAQGVFQNCSNLVTLNMPSTTRTIEYTFCQNCTNLVNLNFYNAENSSQTGAEYNNVLNIIACAFDNCNKLSDTSVAAFTDATLLGWNAFQNCDKISTATVNQLLRQITDGSDTKSGGITIRDNDDYSVAASLFANCDGFTEVTIPSQIVRINDNAFTGCSNLETITIGENVASTGILVFANCTKLHKVNVSRGVAPTCDKAVISEVIQEKQTIDGEEQMVDVTHYYNIFNNVPANQVTLNFTVDATSTSAESGYKTYRANAHFMYLLTKTLDESDTKYDVAGQMHADVVLKRTMVEGWNTVALPFGVKSGDAEARDRDGITAAGVYQKAFNGDKFMIAAYRGIDNDVFKFLKYANYEQDPLDEFEPLLIRMGSGNISANNEYTFVDVDLNYDVEENKLYRDGNAAEEVPVKRWDTVSSSFKPFIGSNYNHDWDWFSKTTPDFAFTGTYFTKTTKDKGENFNYTRDYFIQPGDYIIQSNLFYETLDTKQYRLKGYRAWFQKQPTTAGARPAQLMFRVMELDSDMPTEIDSFDAVDNEVKPFDVYSIGGQLLRKQTKSLNGLPNGIYIVNGRKVAVGK